MSILDEASITSLRPDLVSLCDTADAYYEALAIIAELQAEIDRLKQPPAPAPSGVMPKLRTWDLSETVGINLQLGRTDRAYSYLREPAWMRVIDNMKYLGLRHVRDQAPPSGSPYYPDAWNTIAASGLKFCCHIAPAANYAGTLSLLAPLRQLEQAYPGSVWQVEGGNEINNFFGNPDYTDRNGIWRDGNGTATSPGHIYRQDDLYFAVGTDPVFANAKEVHRVLFDCGDAAIDQQGIAGVEHAAH